MTMGRLNAPLASSLAFEARAAACCSGEWKKMADLYCVPMSGPWRFGVVGLWWGLCAGLTVVAVLLFLRFDRLSRRMIDPLHHGEPLDLTTGAE